MIKAIADLHLALSVPDKDMSIFGSNWKDYMLRLRDNWKNSVSESDLVLIAGDISWAMRLEEMSLDLQFLSDLPGKKILIKGNHDYWASKSVSKIRQFLPNDCFFLGNDYFVYENTVIVGARLWSSSSIKISFSIFQDSYKEKEEKSLIDEEKIFIREKNKLKYSLERLPKNIENKIVMTHFPPIGTNYEENEITQLLENHCVRHCIFGHLHNVRSDIKKSFCIRGVHYHLVSADSINFSPVNICE